MADEEPLPSLCDYEFPSDTLDPKQALHNDFPYENMFNQENLVQVHPLLDQEWGSCMEWGSCTGTLNQIFEPREKEGYAKQFPNEIDDVLAMQELSGENNWTENLHTYLVSDSFFKPPQDYEETKDMQVYQEQRQQQRERIAYLEDNFDYNSCDQQKQQLEGGQNNSLEKRKNHSHYEEEFSKNKKQQHSFVPPAFTRLR